MPKSLRSKVVLSISRLKKGQLFANSKMKLRKTEQNLCQSGKADSKAKELRKIEGNLGKARTLFQTKIRKSALIIRMKDSQK